MRSKTANILHCAELTKLFQTVKLNTLTYLFLEAASKKQCAGMAELADAPDLGSGVLRCAGSTPVTRTIAIGQKRYIDIFSAQFLL